MTMLEMLVVVALTVLVTAIGYPAIDHMARGMAFEAARATLVADLQATRGAAIRTGRPAGMRIAADGTRYAWAGGEVRLTDGIRLGADAPIGFYADGSAAPSRLTLVRGTQRAAIGIAGATGAIVPAR